MEIRVNIVINCVIFIPYLLAKPFSLNKAIAEEVRGKQSLQATSRSKSAETINVKLIDKSLQLSTTKIPSEHDTSSKEISKVTNRKTTVINRKAYKINPPLKPKKLKSPQTLRYKIRNKTGKRTIGNNEIFSRKYIPLLKSLSMLFDNLLNPDKSNSYEITKNKYRRHYQYTNNEDEPECACAFKPFKKLMPHETPITITTTLPTKIANDFSTIAFAETSTLSTDNIATGYIGSYERNKNLPILLTGNTSSRRRNNNGIGQRNGSTNYRSSERHFSRNHGDNECDTRSEENALFTQYYEKLPISTPRDYASSARFPKRFFRNRNVSRHSEIKSTTNYSTTTEENSFEKFGRNFVLLKGENKFKTGGHKTKGSIPLPNLLTGVRRYTIENETEPTKSTTTYKNYEESNLHVSLHSPSHKRFFDRNGSHSPENQSFFRTDEAVISSLPFATIAPVKNKTAVVTIFDGYSVARDVNGENKLTEKTVLIHT